MRQVSLLTLFVALLVPAIVAHNIKHVVVLMQENRSFDHICGYLNRINYRLDGITGSEYNPYNTSDPRSELVYHSDNAEFVDPDPGHSVGSTTEQIFGKDQEDLSNVLMNGFVQNNEKILQGLGERVMRGFKPENVPAAAFFAEEFATFDRYFSSVPGPTQPNRFYLHSATSHGLANNDVRRLAIGFDHKTVFENLDENGLTWGSYFQEVPATVFFKYLRRPPHIGKIHHYRVFKEQVKNGTLPTYSFIDPRYFDLPNYAANDDHPDHDVSEGQLLMKEVYELIRNSPIWEETLLLITYDEHGGFYDHVPTPVRGVPNPDGIISEEPPFDFDRLGVRVPMFAISPWVERGLVVHGPEGPESNSEYEHSSVHATLKNLFGLQSFLTERDAWAGSFHHIVERSSLRTDCPTTIPAPTKSLRHFPQDGSRPLTEFQEELVILAGSLNMESPLDHIDELQKMTSTMNVLQAAKFIRKEINKFFGRNMYPEEEMAFLDSL